MRLIAVVVVKNYDGLWAITKKQAPNTSNHAILICLANFVAPSASLLLKESLGPCTTFWGSADNPDMEAMVLILCTSSFGVLAQCQVAAQSTSTLSGLWRLLQVLTYVPRDWYILIHNIKMYRFYNNVRLFQIFAGLVLHTCANSKPHKLLGVGIAKFSRFLLRSGTKAKTLLVPLFAVKLCGCLFFLQLCHAQPWVSKNRGIFTWLHVRPGTFDLSKSKAGDHRKPFARPTHTLQKMQGMPKNTNGMIESHWNQVHTHAPFLVFGWIPHVFALGFSVPF